MRPIVLGLVAFFSAVVAQPALAEIVTVDIPEAGNFDLIGNGDAAVIYQGVKFSQSAALSDGNLFNVSTGFSGNPAVLSSQQQTRGIPNILISLPSLASSATISFGTFFAGPVSFLLSNGLSFTQSSGVSFYAVPFTFSSGSTSSFSSILVTSTEQQVLSIGRVTYDTAVSAVPEIATWAMMILGFGVLGGATRYRRRKTTLAFT